MHENLEAVQRSFGVLVGTLSGYIGQSLSKIYKDRWWDIVLDKLQDQQRNLPWDGDYADLVDSLDIANCIRLLDRCWNDVFQDQLDLSCRSYAKELMVLRNIVAHHGQQDLDQHVAERGLDTMFLLCDEIDKDSAKEIRKLYREVRSRAGDTKPLPRIEYTGLEQPESTSVRGPLKEGSLLQARSPIVKKTAQTRKVTFGGKTALYPVYQVRLDALYYNDQNDRIATRITRYEAENGEDSLKGLAPEIYNMVIEDFIVDSNPEAIKKTQKNISIVGQREPGVALADGRIVDGNRRFTCLRRLQRVSQEPLYFETVLMDVDIQADRKQIKLLELAIQHGEESKVDYDKIDYAVGTYRDIVETGLLTVEEYAASANETPADVNKRLQVARMISEFQQYIRLPGQYHVAREYEIYSVLEELLAPLKQVQPEEQNTLKTIAFDNAVTGAIADQRKFVRDIKTLVRSGTYGSFFAEQEGLHEKLQECLAPMEVKSKEDLDRVALEHPTLVDEFRASMERAMLRSRSTQLKAKPLENVGKCVSLLLEVDPRQFGRMDPEERETLSGRLGELTHMIEDLQDQLGKA